MKKLIALLLCLTLAAALSVVAFAESEVSPVVAEKAAAADEPKAENKAKKSDESKKAKADKKDSDKKDAPKAELKPRVADKIPEWNEPVEW